MLLIDAEHLYWRFVSLSSVLSVSPLSIFVALVMVMMMIPLLQNESQTLCPSNHIVPRCHDDCRQTCASLLVMVGGICEKFKGFCDLFNDSL